MNPLEAGRRLGEMAAREQRQGNFRAAAKLYMHAVLALTALGREQQRATPRPGSTRASSPPKPA